MSSFTSLPKSDSSSTNHMTNCQHHHVTSSLSTNSELLTAVKSGDIEANLPFMLTADMQTSGRGQHSRTWQSPKGNVYLSLYHPMDIPVSGLMSLVVAYHLTKLPIIQSINRHYRQQGLPTIGVKWVNDVGFYDLSKDQAQNQKNKLIFNKLAGILIEPVLKENRLIGVVVGVGLNVANVPVLNTTTSEGMDYRAVGLNELLRRSELANSELTRSELTKNEDIIDQKSKHVIQPTAQVLQTMTASDLYLPVRNAIIQAVKRFKAFATDPYTVHQFISDYENVNVLVHRQVVIKQQISAMNSDKGQKENSDKDVAKNDNRKAIIESKLEGEVLGINSNGSLKIKPLNGSSQVMDVYTGTIHVVS